MSMPGRLRRLGRAVAYGVLTSVLLTGLAFVVREKVHAVIDADNDLIRMATDVTRAHPAFRTFLLHWQWTTQPIRVYLVATLICLWAWLVKGFRTRAWWAFATMMVGWFVALQIKEIVKRARPVVSDPVSHAPGYSFPSGHASNATLAAAVLTILLWPILRSSAARAVVAALAVVLTVGTALDRVFLGVHFPSDVIAGVIFGVGLAVASYAGYLGWNPPKEQS